MRHLRRRAPRFLPLLSLAAALAMGWGCRALGGEAAERAAGGGREGGFDVRSMVAAHHYVLGGWHAAGLRFGHKPRLAVVTVDDEQRQAVLGTARGWTWQGWVPPGARLHVGAQVLPGSGAGADAPAPPAITAIVATVAEVAGSARRYGVAEAAEREPSGGRRTFVSPPPAGPAGEPHWLDLDADLAPWAGREVEIAVSARMPAPEKPVPDAPPDDPQDAAATQPVIAWGPAELAPPPAAAPARHPNVIFILIDTLRRDRLTPYGYARPTSPQIERWLAARGTVADEAYSQAPWTLPSVVSFMTGRYTRALLGPWPPLLRVPKGVEPLAERMEDLGYSTGAFVANPIFGAQTNLERGFQTYFLPTWHGVMNVSGFQVNRHAIPWLARHADRPFFLYVHYADPHDPYDDPDIVDNRSPFETAAYSGPVTGTWPERLHSSGAQLPDPPRDLAHLNALYDAEVRYVDRAVGELLAAVPPAALANTLVVLTADHGEEIDDHGGWKHAQSLFDELIHVPLLFRWDGHIPAGRRLASTVRLVDLLPTLMDAVGGAPDPAASGIDLLPYLTAGRAAPELPAYAEGYAAGPVRVAAVVGRTKLVLFNREQPYMPSDSEIAWLYLRDRLRMDRIERYDLARDPGEHHNLSGDGVLPADARLDLLQETIARQMDPGMDGARILVQRAPVGATVVVTVRFAERAQCGAYFLGAADRVEGCGDTVRFTLRGDGLEKGVEVLGAHRRPLGDLLSAAATVDGRPLPDGDILLGRGVPYRGGPMRAEALTSPTYPGQAPPGSGCRVLIWGHGEPTPAETVAGAAAAADLKRRLKALGYVR